MKLARRRALRASSYTARGVRRVLCAIAMFASFTVPGFATPSACPGASPVRLQLKWRHQFQFAGYYAALQQGYYCDAGFDVRIDAATPATNPIAVVLGGQAEFGVASSELVLHFANGEPLVALAVLFQHSPLTLYARADTGIDSVHDLVGRRVAIAAWETEIFAYLQREQVPTDRLQLVQHDFSVDALVAGRIDALAGYETDEAFVLSTAPGKYQRFSPRASGVDFYGDTLFTTRALTKAQPARVAAFRAASLRGWDYALSHSEDMVELIHTQYAPDLSLDKLRFEAKQMQPFIRTDLVELGHSFVGRWQHILDVYRELGLVPASRDVDVSALLYQESRPIDLRWLSWVLGLGLVVLAGVTLVGHRFYRLSRTLDRELAENRRLNAELLRLSEIDPLTGVLNRRSLDDALRRELDRATRAGGGLALIMIDIDDFKALNDLGGHAAGDALLRAFGPILMAQVRAGDLVFRLGGDEFLLLLPGADEAAAVRCAEAVRRAFGVLAANTELPGVRCALSLGVTLAHKDDDTPAALLSRGDRALYAAKQLGKDRVAVLH